MARQGVARQGRAGEAGTQIIKENTMKASWKKGYHSKIKPDIAFNELEKIKKSNGGVLTAGIVLLKATKKTSKLHKAFEWDNSKAAAEYRLTQARSMLRSIEVIYPESPKQQPHRHYITTKEPAKDNQPTRNIYLTTKEILQDPIARDELLGGAIREALSFRRKYAELSELAGVFTALDNFVTDAKMAG